MGESRFCDDLFTLIYSHQEVGAGVSKMNVLLYGNFVVYDGESHPEIGVRNASLEEARATIRELKDQCVDFIKIYEKVAFLVSAGT